jgi:CTP:molybdopterin cytidylyltransferase MocA
VVSAVVLAAGAATRFGSPKQLLLLPYVLDRLDHAPIDEVVIVAGAYPIVETRALSLGEARVVECPDWELGPGASLRCGLAALSAASEAALVVLADGPFLDPRAVERVLAHRELAPIVAASYQGLRGHPAVFSRAAFAEIPDDGGRGLEALLVPCDDLIAPGDIDTPELARDL